MNGGRLRRCSSVNHQARMPNLTPSYSRPTYYYHYYYRWHRESSCQFNYRDVKLKYDIRSAFWCNSTWESFKREDFRI